MYYSVQADIVGCLIPSITAQQEFYGETEGH